MSIFFISGRYNITNLKVKMTKSFAQEKAHEEKLIRSGNGHDLDDSPTERTAFDVNQGGRF